MVDVRWRIHGLLAGSRTVSQAAVLALTCLAPMSAHAEDTLDKIRRTGALSLAFPLNHFPFAEATSDGRATGYSIDICLKIAEGVRRELKLPALQIHYVPVDIDARFKAIASGEADIECGSTTNNAARRVGFSFTVPHFYTTTRMMVRSDSGIRSWVDMREKRVVTVRGSSILPYVKARDAAGVLYLKWSEVASDADAVAMVTQGRADAYAEDEVLLRTYRGAAADPQALAVVGEALSVDPYAMMMRRDDAAFKAVVDREMVRLITDGDIYGIYDHWFLQVAGTRRQTLGIPMSYVLRDSFRFPSDKVAQ